MSRAPALAGTPRARLALAAGLCAVPLRLVWSTTLTPGTTLYGDCGYSDGPYCVPNQYLPGSVHSTLVSQSPMRVFLVVAIVGLVACAVRTPSAATRRLTRVTCAVLVLGAAVAVGHGASRVLVCVLAALALVAPLVVRRGGTGLPAVSGATHFGAARRDE